MTNFTTNLQPTTTACRSKWSCIFKHQMFSRHWTANKSVSINSYLYSVEENKVR